MAETSQIINVPRDTTMQAGNTQLAAIVTKLQAICDALGLSSPLLADDFDPAVSYSPGDYCIKDGTLYRCNTATTADAPWDVTEWTATSVTQEFIRLQAILGDEDISAIGDGTVTGAITTLNSTLAGLIKKETYNGTTNTSGSLALNNYASNRIIIGVSLDTTNSYIATIGYSSNVLYIHVTDENGNKIANTSISGTYAYIDY